MGCKTNLRILREMTAANRAAGGSTTKFLAGANNIARKSPDMLYEVYVNSILSGPITHGVNIGSNALLTTWMPTQKMLQAVSAATRRDWEAARIQGAQSLAQYVGIVEGIGEAFRIQFLGQSADAAGYGHITDVQEIARQRNNPAITGDGINSPAIAKTLDVFGNYVRMPGEALLAEDRFFKIIHNRMVRNSQAVMSVESTMAGASRQAKKELYQQLRTANPTEATKKAGTKQADYFTFTNQLGPNAAKILRGLRTNPVFNYAVPFFNTPTNIVKMGLRNSVFGNVFYDLLPALKGTGIEKDVARAKIAMGTAIPLALISLMDDDSVTGRIDMSTTEGRFKNEIAPAYSLKIGGTWVSYENIEPFRSIVGLYATWAEVYNGLTEFDPVTGMPNDAKDQAFIAALAPAIQTIGDTYMLDAIGGVLNVFENMKSGNPESTQKALMKLATSSTIPAFFKQTNRAFNDNVFRKAEGYMDQLAQVVPWLSRSLPPQYTLWGEERVAPSGIPVGALSPIATKYADEDEVDRAVIALEVNIRQTPKKFTYQGYPIEFSTKQQSQWEYFRGNGIGNNPKLKDYFRKAMNSSVYIGAAPMDKKTILETVIGTYESAALDYLMGTDPDLQAQWKTAIAAKQAERLRTTP